MSANLDLYRDRDVELARALRGLVPPAMAAALRTGARALIDGDLDGLHEVERAVVAHAIDRRRREFASGRALLRELLGADVAIGALPSRAPAWPPGVIGSLAHDDELAVAVLCVADPHGDASDATTPRALGIDVEREGSADDVASAILVAAEGALDATVALCAKEATYKAWSALGGAVLEHQDITVTLDGASFVAVVAVRGGNERAVASGAARPTAYRGSLVRGAGRVLALVVA